MNLDKKIDGGDAVVLVVAMSFLIYAPFLYFRQAYEDSHYNQFAEEREARAKFRSDVHCFMPESAKHELSTAKFYPSDYRFVNTNKNGTHHDEQKH